MTCTEELTIPQQAISNDIRAQSNLLCSTWEQQRSWESRPNAKSSIDLPEHERAIRGLVALLFRAFENGMKEDFIHALLCEHLPAGLYERLTNLSVVIYPSVNNPKPRRRQRLLLRRDPHRLISRA